MRYVPSLPPLAGVPESGAVKELQHAQPVRPVRERLFPAHIAERYPPRESTENPATALATGDKRDGKERRQLCRRIASVEPLLETRSDIERRKRNRRRGDLATSVDEEV